MKPSEFFCPLPWIHQFIQPTGIKVCCSSTKELKLSPTEFNNSQYLKDIKQTIRSGEVPKDCRSCSANERMGFGSTRINALRDWDYTIDNVPDRIEYLDLRYNNLCNFSCRTCEPLFSTSIDKEIKLNPILNKYFKPVDLLQVNVGSINEFLPTLKRLNLTGGEPLLIKEHLDVLKTLIDNKQTDIDLLITTNASVINPKILSLISEFKNVHWTVSIDGIGKAAEYIRNATKWSIVEQNLHTILALKQSVFINTTVSAYSVFGLADIANWFNQLKLQYNSQPFEIMFSVVQFPTYLQPNAIASKNVELALYNIQTCVDILEFINPMKFNEPLKNLHLQLSSAILDNTKFVEYTHTLDDIRNQSFSEVFKIEL